MGLHSLLICLSLLSESCLDNLKRHSPPPETDFTEYCRRSESRYRKLCHNVPKLYPKIIIVWHLM